MLRPQFCEQYEIKMRTLEECKKIAAEESYGVIPISTEMYADMTTPIEVDVYKRQKLTCPKLR